MLLAGCPFAFLPVQRLLTPSPPGCAHQSRRCGALQSAKLFLDSCDAFRDFISAVSTLDALAGFAAATHPLAAPPGCTFSRPTFAAAAHERSGDGPAPLLNLHGVWSPALLASGVDSIKPNSLQLGGTQRRQGAAPGLMLLTGANTGGKSTLLRATCLAAIMAQVWFHCRCYSMPR